MGARTPSLPKPEYARGASAAYLSSGARRFRAPLSFRPTMPADLDPIVVPAARQAEIRRLAEELRPGLRVALSTHINADGDGCGSETALARLLGQMGITAHIVNPTPWPAMFAFLLGSDVRDRSMEGEAALRDADRLVVLDISDVGRLGVLAPAVRASRVPPLVIDHHLPGEEPRR